MRVTLTIPNGEHLKPLLDRLYSDFRKMRDADRKGRHLIVGGYAKLDCKRTKADAWHPHFDCVVEAPAEVSLTDFRRYIADRWEGIVRVERVKDADVDRERLVRYDHKLTFGSFTERTDLMVEYRSAVKGKAKFFRFGKWRNVATDRDRWERLERPQATPRPEVTDERQGRPDEPSDLSHGWDSALDMTSGTTTRTNGGPIVPKIQNNFADGWDDDERDAAAPTPTEPEDPWRWCLAEEQDDRHNTADLIGWEQAIGPMTDPPSSTVATTKGTTAGPPPLLPSIPLTWDRWQAFDP